MTPQEAKKELMHINLILVYQMDLARAEKEKDMLNRNYQANNIAISALEKQIPKKVVVEGITKDVTCCPNCTEVVDSAFCPECGQALDWEDEGDSEKENPISITNSDRRQKTI